jgi:hypothetical protein
LKKGSRILKKRTQYIEKTVQDNEPKSRRIQLHNVALNTLK